TRAAPRVARTRTSVFRLRTLSPWACSSDMTRRRAAPRTREPPRTTPLTQCSTPNGIRASPAAAHSSTSRYGPQAKPPPFLRVLNSAFVNRQPLLVPFADVLAVRPDQPVVGVLFDHMGRPPRHPADGEDRGEQVGGDAQVVVDRGRVEVHVRVEALLREDDLLHLPGHPEVRVVSGRLGELLRH